MINATPAREIGVDRKFTLYINDDDRDEIEKLREEMTPLIAGLPNRKDYMDKHGRLSVAGLFRYLRHVEMERRGLRR